MPEPITLTLNDLWLFLLAFAGGLSTISAGIAVIVNIIHKAKAPNKKQDERIAALEERAKKIEERLELGDKRFEVDSIAISEPIPPIAIPASALVRASASFTPSPVIQA